MIRYNTPRISSGVTFLLQMASINAHTMIAAMAPICYTSLSKTAHNVDGVVYSPMPFEGMEIVTHS